MGAQSVYKFSTPVGQAGGIYDLSPYAVDSFVNESADGVVKPGTGVVRGTAAGKQAKGPNAGSTAALFEGIVTNRRTTENALSGGVVIKSGTTLGVMRYGRIFGLLAADAEPAYGDAVYMVQSGDDAGCFTNAADNGETGDGKVSYVAIKGRFLSGASDGIALIELFNQQQ